MLLLQRDIVGVKNKQGNVLYVLQEEIKHVKNKQLKNLKLLESICQNEINQDGFIIKHFEELKRLVTN